MSLPLGLLEAVMLELIIMAIGLRELYVLRKDEKKSGLEKRDEDANSSSRDDRPKK